MSTNPVSSAVRRRRPVSDNAYSRWYDAADRLRVLGIACNGVVNALCGEADNPTRVSRAGRLQRLASAPLFQALRRNPVTVTVLMADPVSEFVRVRSEEEKNKRCRPDVVSNLGRLSQMCDDVHTTNNFDIKGRLIVAAYDCNPYVSVFSARNHSKHYMTVGLLFQGALGIDCPENILDQPTHKQIREAVDTHFDIVSHASTTVLDWHPGRPPEFRRSFAPAEKSDVFICYNARDRDVVRPIARELRKQGITCWFDEWTLGAGAVWSEKLEEALTSAMKVAVFLGPYGDGPWQEMEIRMALSLFARRQIEIVPVVLPGVSGEARHIKFLDEFHHVDLRPDWRQRLSSLEEALRTSRG